MLRGSILLYGVGGARYQIRADLRHSGRPVRSWPAGILYVVVWLLIGTFFVASVYFADAAQSWGREGRWVSGFVLAYTLALAGGFAIQITAALLLRGLTRVTGLNRVVHWIGFGAAVGVALPWTVARLGYLLEGLRFPHEWQNVKSVLMFPLMGAMMHEVHPAWVLAAVGAATAGTVRLMVRRLVQGPRLDETRRSQSVALGPTTEVRAHLQRLLDAPEGSSLILEVPRLQDAFLQFTAGRDAIQIDYPLITGGQCEREDSLRRAFAAAGLTPYETRGSDGARFLDCDVPRDTANAAHLIQKILESLYGINSSTELRFVGNGLPRSTL